MADRALSSVELLFAEFPAWRSLAKREVDTDGSEYTVVEIPPPAEANVEHGLVIDTSNDEVTVGFDAYHSHFNDWVGDGNQFGTQAAIEFIRQVVEEKVAVISWWYGDQWRGSAQLEAGAPVEPPSWVGAEAYNRFRVRSWNGTFNVDSDA